MRRTISDEQTAARRAKVLVAARWCFLNFGFEKTSFDDIAKRTGLSRTLLYRLFENKEAVYREVFADWLLSRQPEAMRAATGPGSRFDRLVRVCRIIMVEPWAEMVSAPVGDEFFDICERIDPDSEALYRRVMLECVDAVLADGASSLVFLLALDGLLGDRPSLGELEERIRVLAARFARPIAQRKARP
jgi:TetR/AcrR family transcriptional regulator, transcriptional repressor of aconitase